jgi:hypothetical protein
LYVTNTSLKIELLIAGLNIKINTLNIIVQWLTLLLSIREALGASLGPETAYPEMFRVFLQPL